jgi:hypothetical protein
MFSFNITTEQVMDSLLAIPAFFPALVCTGYLAAWFTNLQGFRQRSLLERFFWSVPLSIAVSSIASVLIGRFLSLAAVVAFFLASGAIWLFILGREWLQLRHSGSKLKIGWQPLGSIAAMMAITWIVVAILSLVDFQSNQRLYMSVTAVDHAPRVNWTDSVLRTGVPPANPLYYYGHSAPIRYYYFWYVVCAATGKMAHLPIRAIFIASCVWSGFALAALLGLFLKHFLDPGELLRRRFLLSISLLTVTGLDICVILYNLVFHHSLPPADLEWWSAGQVTSWFDSLLWVPHHIASMECCMLALLLAWMAGKNRAHSQIASVTLIAAALASAFGLSIYVAFAFFLVMLAWAVWQSTVEHSPRSPMLLASGGLGAILLLLPYLWELMHNSSKMQGGAVFTFAIREMIDPTNCLLATHFFQHLNDSHPLVASNLANLILLIPGYCIELGFYFAVLLIFLIPVLRGRKRLTPAQRSLVFIAGVTLLFVSVMRSSVLTTNDFGWRGALLMQFPLLLLATDVLGDWGFLARQSNESTVGTGLSHHTRYWLRCIAYWTLVIGVTSTLCQAFLLRFYLPLRPGPNAVTLSHKAYFSSIGYAQLDAVIPHDSIVQYNPRIKDNYDRAVNLFGINHQSALVSDQPWCGSELGGDPSGCLAMASAVDSLFNGATAEQAHATCRQYNIDYLVVTVYDPVWNDRRGWVWTLRPVVSDQEFRALDCHQ